MSPWRGSRRQNRKGGPGLVISNSQFGDNFFAVGHAEQVIMPPNGGREFRLEPLRPESRLGRAKALKQPSRLLHARYGAVAFTGRNRELAQLAEWQGDGENGPRVAVRLVHGEGGQGKTRLAAHFASASHRGRWVSWKAVHDAHAALMPLPSSLHAEGDLGIVVVVDYADRWPPSLLSGMLRWLADQQAALPVRVLLLARSAGHWWRSLSYNLDKNDIEHDDMPLASLAETSGERAALYKAAVEQFAAAMHVKAPKPLPTPDLDQSDYRLVLSVHMAALAAVDAHVHNESAPTDPARVSEYLLVRESTHWSTLVPDSDGNPRTEQQLMGRAVYTAILTGAITPEQGEAALTRAKIISSPQLAPPILRDHAVFYPPQDPKLVLEPMYPDRLAEDFLALSTPTPDTPSTFIDPRTAEIPRLLVKPADDGNSGAQSQLPQWGSRTLTTLAEAARRWRHVAVKQLRPLLFSHPGLFIEAGGAVLASLAANPHLDETALEALQPHLPPHRQVNLDAGIAAITERLAESRLQRADTPTEQLQILNELGTRLTYAGLYDQAGETTRRSLQLIGALPEDEKAEHASTAAVSLTNLGASLCAMGRPTEALVPSEEAVRLIRPSANDGSPAHAARLAVALSNLREALVQTGQWSKALKPAREAVQLLRRHAQDSEIYAPALAHALSGLGCCLWELGQHDSAVVTTRSCLTVRQRLAHDNPGLYEPELAETLDNLATMLTRMGRHSEALDMQKAAVELLERLAEANRRAHGPRLGQSLDNLSLCMAEHGRYADAVAASGRAVAVRRQLADSIGRRLELAVSLDILGTAHLRAKEFHSAETSLREAASLFKQEAAYPEHLDYRLFSVLINLSSCLSRLEQRDEALAIALEAEHLSRGLAERDAPGHSHRLATSLALLADTLTQLGRTGEALSAVEEALDIRRRLSAMGDARTASIAGLEPALHALTTALDALGPQDVELLARINAATTLLPRPTQAGPETDSFQQRLCILWQALGVQLSAANQYPEALTATEEAITLARQLAPADAFFHMVLAGTLSNLSLPQLALGQTEQALAAAQESVAHFRRLSSYLSPSNEGLLMERANALANLSTIQSIRQEWTAALATVHEEIQMYEALAPSARSHWGERLRAARKKQQEYRAEQGREA